MRHSNQFSQSRAFHKFGTSTITQETNVHHGDAPVSVPTFVNEFWTAKQRAAHSLHEVSYRASGRRGGGIHSARKAGNRGSLADPGRELLLVQFVVLPQVEAAAF